MSRSTLNALPRYVLIGALGLHGAFAAGTVVQADSRQGTANVQALTTRDCEPDQVLKIQMAVDGAQEAAFGALLDISALGGNGDSTRFDYWFGGHSDAVVEFVAQTFRTTYSYVNSIEYICKACNGDAPDFYGAVTGRIEDGMELCAGFFAGDAWEIGAGTILHEFAHLNGVPPDNFDICNDPASAGTTWPDAWHRYALTYPEGAGATTSPENYRLYGLDWQPGEASSVDWCAGR